MPFIDIKNSLKPEFSYLYPSKFCDCYYYPLSDSQKEKGSLLPSFKMNGKTIFFAFNGNYILDCENEFIDSPEKLIKKIGLPQQIKQEELDKFAIMVNYLSQGQTYTYIDKTAKQEQGEKFTFKVHQGAASYQVSLSPSNITNIHYELIAVKT
jgi:hypothetical protein